jgi:hypothetical protein
MNSRPIVIGGILPKEPTQVCLPKYDHMVETFPWIVPISLSTYAFCQGEPGAMGLSRMPMARNRRVTAAP